MRGSSMVTFVPEIVSVPAPLGSLARIRNGLNQVAAENPKTRSTTNVGTAIRRKRTRRLWRLATRNACERSERRDAVQPSLRSAVAAVVRRFVPHQARNQARGSYAAWSGGAKWPGNVAPPGRASPAGLFTRARKCPPRPSRLDPVAPDRAGNESRPPQAPPGPRARARRRACLSAHEDAARRRPHRRLAPR